MTPTAASAPAFAPSPAQATRPGTAPVRTAEVGALPTVSDTPARLRRLSLVLVVTGLVVGLVAAVSLGLLTSSLQRAQADTAQLVRVQKIETDLLVADANATNTFLVGGLESTQSRQAYANALTEVGSLVAEAASAQPADAAALAALNTEVLDYAALVESARANNRQGFPVGAQYLKQASAGLRTDALPIADALVSANAERAGGAMSAAWGWPLVVVTVLGLGVFGYAQVWLARRFRRRISPALLIASLVLLGLLVSCVVALSVVAVSVRVTRDDEFADVKHVASARTQANLAKSSESLTLIARGSGGSYEQSWQSSAADVERELGTLRDAGPVLRDWRRYEQTHVTIRSLDDGGRWDAAVALATGAGAASSNAQFGTVDQTMASIVDGAQRSTQVSLGSHRAGLVVGAVLALVAGVAAAWLGRRGVAARLREYR